MQRRDVVVTAICLTAWACGGGNSGGPPDAGDGAAGASVAGEGAGGAGMGAGGADGASGSAAAGTHGDTERWNDLPGGEGEQADSHQSTCERQCQNDGACEVKDAARCADDCDDPRRRCQADLFSDTCWTKMLAWRECVAGLDCEQLEHYYYRASTPDRPCMAEVDDLARDCPDPTSAFYSECFGENLECPTGSERESVPAFSICDGKRDCSDGRDEDSSLCTWRSE